jgi:ribonuclease-3
MHPLLKLSNEALLRQALTHRSYANENPNEPDNERLEFLGDAVLNFLSGDYLYRRYPQMAEDAMTRCRSALVDERQLAAFAVVVGLNRHMRLGKGALQSGGLQNPNLLSSTFEAVVGAYYLDHDRQIEALRPLIEELFNMVPHLDREVRSDLNAKSQLQEWVQKQLGSVQGLIYQTTRVGGPDHAPDYLTKVWVGGALLAEGRGRGKQAAEKQAAQQAIAQLQQQNRW